jgi:para-nitrobenzyl esterase
MSDSMNFDRRAVMAMGAAVAAAPGLAAATDGPVATTRLGKVQGYVDGGIAVFKGVPYAADTAAANRFKPPRPRARWSGVLPCGYYGARAPQIAPPPTQAFTSWTQPIRQDVDCLSVNVWTPGVDDRRRPVMVWIHGGGYAVGSGGSNAYDGTRLARRGDVVVVTLNHRLNLFGYVYLADVAGPAYADSGNIGQLDIMAALKWVRANIAAFGGDPANVTIFGESGGGGKVACLLAAPPAKGLFDRSIQQSGPGVRQLTVEEAVKNRNTLFGHAGLRPNQWREFAALPVPALLDALYKMTGGAPTGFGPVVDGRALPRHPFDPDAPDVSKDVPMMIGCNDTETTVLFPTPDLFSLDWAGLKTKLAPQMPGADVDGLIAGFRKLRPAATASQLYFVITTETGMSRGTMQVAERKVAKGGAPVYVYRLDWKTPVEGGRLGSPHALDIALVFDNVHTSRSILGPPTADVQKVADAMSSAWIAFARTGSPNGPGLPAWPAFDVARRPTMVFDVVSRSIDDPLGQERAMLAANRA